MPTTQSTNNYLNSSLQPPPPSHPASAVAIPQGADANEVLLTSPVPVPPPPSPSLRTQTKLTATGAPKPTTSTNCLTSNPTLASTVPGKTPQKHAGKLYSGPCSNRRKTYRCLWPFGGRGPT